MEVILRRLIVFTLGRDFINPDRLFFSEIGVEVSISGGMAPGDSG